MSDSTGHGAPPHEVQTLVAHVFRRWHSQLIAALVRMAGAHEMDTVEDAVQDALLAAMQHWPFRGIPTDPHAWLYQVARRKLLDRLARNRSADSYANSVGASESAAIAADGADHNVSYSHDDELTMLFLAAHPSLNTDAQVTLMLRTVCGLTTSEIALALLTPETTVAQRLVRAKRTLGELAAPFALPDEPASAIRVEAVLRALYLMFTEGYAASSGDSVVRRELCNEATRLATLLAQNESVATPTAFALCALFEFQSSRLSARQRADGRTVPLGEQDRSLWSRDAISRGMHWFARAAQGDEISEYHLQAAIAAEHARTFDGSATNWERIRTHYEHLLVRNMSPIVRMNHAYAVARTEGANTALQLLSALESEPRLAANHLLPAMQAVLLAELGRTVEAAASTRLALQRVRTFADRALLLERAQALEGVSLLSGVLN